MAGAANYHREGNYLERGRCPEQIPTQMKRRGASRYFRSAGKHSKWDVLSGFHVLRHSFGSNLARTGAVASSTIGAWMGHSTAEMRELYQHLFPQDGIQQICCLA